jgi:hypothetical protein
VDIALTPDPGRPNAHGPGSTATATAAAPDTEPARALPGPLHLLHRPVTSEGFLLDATAPEEQHFALSAELPYSHALFNDGPGTFHDVLFPAETLCQATRFVAHQYFRVPEDRPEVFASSSVDVLALEPWRRSGRPAHLALELTLTPVDVVNGVPRGLDCLGRAAIDGVRCGVTRAKLVFVMPGVHRSHREHGRCESLHGTAPVPPPGSRSTVPPERVGRGEARNVLVQAPIGAQDGEFVLPVVLSPGHEVFSPRADGLIPSSVYLEASRQAALLVAAELHGFAPGHAVLTHWRVSFRGLGDADLPLSCAVSSRRLTRDAAGRPTARMRVVFSQGSRIVASASAALLQDC